jgi:hypothetical protein
VSISGLNYNVLPGDGVSEGFGDDRVRGVGSGESD